MTSRARVPSLGAVAIVALFSASFPVAAQNRTAPPPSVAAQAPEALQMDTAPDPLEAEAPLATSTATRAGPNPAVSTPRQLSRVGFYESADFQPQERRVPYGLALMAAGGALLFAGSFIDDDAGTVVMVSGAGIVAWGAYRLLR